MEKSIVFPESCIICENDIEIKFTYSHNLNAYLHYSDNLSANVSIDKIKVKAAFKSKLFNIAVQACKKIQKEILNKNTIKRNGN